MDFYLHLASENDHHYGDYSRRKLFELNFEWGKELQLFHIERQSKIGNNITFKGSKGHLASSVYGKAYIFAWLYINRFHVSFDMVDTEKIGVVLNYLGRSSVSPVVAHYLRRLQNTNGILGLKQSAHYWFFLKYSGDSVYYEIRFISKESSGIHKFQGFFFLIAKRTNC